MINILSVRCGLAFAPYLCESFSDFLAGGKQVSRVVRQGGGGLILRTGGELMLRYQNREATLALQEADRYLAALEFRADFYDVVRTSDEVVLATIAKNLLLSHPQSELWLEARTVARLLDEAGDPAAAGSDADSQSFSDSLSVAVGGGGLLLSDRRTGRWVLLGPDHLAELGRRLPSIEGADEPAAGPAPPTIPLKGVTVHLQSAFRVARTLERFAESGEVEEFEDVTPAFTLRAARSVEGLELVDSNNRVAMTSKEARKWSAIINSELTKLNAAQAESGRIRTVFADGGGGRWVMQWGDEVFVPEGARLFAETSGVAVRAEQSGPLVMKRGGEFLLLMSKATAACVALTGAESKMLFQS